jgi:DNA repair photolyase
MKLPVVDGDNSDGAAGPLRGRGAAGNPRNRFAPLDVVADPDVHDLTPPAARTVYLHDTTRSIIAYNDSPDVGFDAGINPYRGCEHGCVYCFARPTHEYLDFSLGLDFETRILVKVDAPELLRKELGAKGWRPQTLGFSGVTDAYQPVERKLRLTRRCLEVIAEFRNPVAMITKNHLITRDADLLGELARHDAAMACISVTTLDPDLARTMEPRASAPRSRLDAIRTLADAGVPVGVLVAPVVPGLTDHEMLPIIAAAREHGARFAAYVPLRLPFGLKDLFEDWLARHFPDRKDKVLNRIRSIRGGKLYEGKFHDRMTGEGPFAEQMATMFKLACRRAGMTDERLTLTTAAFRRYGAQSLFD